jgi:hypothetical protein
MFLGDDEPLPADELQRYADAGVRVFLTAYSQRSGPRGALYFFR